MAAVHLSRLHEDAREEYLERNSRPARKKLMSNRGLKYDVCLTHENVLHGVDGSYDPAFVNMAKCGTRLPDQSVEEVRHCVGLKGEHTMYDAVHDSPDSRTGLQS